MRHPGGLDGSAIAGQAVMPTARPYLIEREIGALDTGARRAARPQRARPIAEEL